MTTRVFESAERDVFERYRAVDRPFVAYISPNGARIMIRCDDQAMADRIGNRLRQTEGYSYILTST